MAQLVVRDSRSLDRFSTDTTWQVSDRGPVRSSNLYDGECYDARYEDSLQWLPAMLLEAPEGILRMQEAPGQTIADSLTAKRIWRNGQTSFIVDMGENMVGWLAVRGKGQTGVPVVIRMAERLAADSQTLYTDNLREARATNCYIPRDSMPFRYCPSTVWQGFRYAEITGLTDMPELTDLTGYIVGDAMRCTGGFHCSDSLLNRLFLAAKRGIRGNYHGFPTDCPQRDERLGWLGDRMTGCYGESFIYDNKALYLKWMQDIEDTQTPAGQLSDIAPAYWGIRKHDNVTWTGTYIAVADMLLERYGCEEGVRRHYDSMRRWVEYTVKQGMRDSIMTIDTYGDWCMPPERPELIHSKDPSRRTEAAVLSTTVMYGLLQKMQRFALLMGRDSDRIAFERLAEGMKRAYNRQFLNPVTGGYSNRTVTANVLSFALGLVPEEERQRVMQQIVQTTETDFNSHVSCGVLGIQHLMRTLSRNGRPDLALRIARQTDFPSWGYMLEHGATTIWELWNGDTAAPEMNSGNHVMLLGDLLLWFYEDLAGIRPDQNGFRHLHMQPCFPDGLDCVDARYESAAGIITSGWQRLPDGSIRWQIGLPEHTGATVVLPDLTTREIKGRQELVFRP
jgi:alpha-L-rhamnosidase